MLSQASLVGRTHRLMWQNGQDCALVGHAAANDCCFGLVADGCGSKTHIAGQSIRSHNEVGARLLGNFTANWLVKHLAPDAIFGDLFAALHSACLVFLAGLLRQLHPAAPTHFIASHLSCTLVGFTVTPEKAAFFWAGDGYLCYDGTIVELQSDNRPHYLAYGLLSSGATSAFETLLLPGAARRWLAVASDGWCPALQDGLATPRPTLALQRWANVQARQRGHFEDDGAVAAWYADPLTAPGAA